MPKNKILAQPETPKTTAPKSCGKALRNVRQTAEITLERLAFLTGVSESALQKIERDALVLKAQVAVQIAAVTGCNPDKLLHGKATDFFGRKYSQASFKAWSSKQSPDAIDVAKQAADRMAMFVRALILCSAGDELRTTPHQYRGVAVQLSDAIETILEMSNLARMPLLARLNEALEALAEPGDWQMVELGHLRSRCRKLPKWKEYDRPTLGDKSMVEVRLTFIPVWNRLAGVVGKKSGKKIYYSAADLIAIDRVRVEVKLDKSQKVPFVVEGRQSQVVGFGLNHLITQPKPGKPTQKGR